LGAINPLLALAATIETGPGKDADCRAALREATAAGANASVNAMANAPASPGSAAKAASPAVLGGPAAAAKPAGADNGPHYPLDKRR